MITHLHFGLICLFGRNVANLSCAAMVYSKSRGFFLEPFRLFLTLPSYTFTFNVLTEACRLSGDFGGNLLEDFVKHQIARDQQITKTLNRIN